MMSTSECQRRLAGEYRICLESIIPRLNSIIEGAYDDTPWGESRQESAKEAKTVIIELLDYVDRIVNVSESEFKRSDLPSLSDIIEYVLGDLIFYTQKLSLGNSLTSGAIFSMSTFQYSFAQDRVKILTFEI